MAIEIPNFNPEQLQLIQYDLIDQLASVHRQMRLAHSGKKVQASTQDTELILELKGKRTPILLGILEIRQKAIQLGVNLDGVAIALNTRPREHVHPYMRNDVTFNVATDDGSSEVHTNLYFLSKGRTDLSSVGVKTLIGTPEITNHESSETYTRRVTHELYKIQEKKAEGLATDPQIDLDMEILATNLIDIRSRYPKVPLGIGMFREQNLILIHFGTSQVLDGGSIGPWIPAIPVTEAYEKRINSIGGFDFWVSPVEGQLSVIENPQRRAA